MRWCGRSMEAATNMGRKSLAGKGVSFRYGLGRGRWRSGSGSGDEAGAGCGCGGWTEGSGEWRVASLKKKQVPQA